MCIRDRYYYEQLERELRDKLPANVEMCIRDRCYVSVADSAFALGNILSAFFGYPSRKLKLVGVTGTNGKTTTATLLYELVRFMGKKAGLLSTVCNYVDGKQYPSTHTTPDPLELNQYLRLMVEAGCEYCFMEVSSHAIHQKLSLIHIFQTSAKVNNKSKNPKPNDKKMILRLGLNK